MINKTKTILRATKNITLKGVMNGIGRGVVKSVKAIALFPFKATYKVFDTIIKFFTRKPITFYQSFQTDTKRQHVTKTFVLIGISGFLMTLAKSVETTSTSNPVYVAMVPFTIIGIMAISVFLVTALLQWFLGYSFFKTARFVAQIQLLISIPSSLFILPYSTGSLENPMLSLTIYLVISMVLIVMYSYSVMIYMMQDKKEELRRASFSENSFSSKPIVDDVKLSKWCKFNIIFIITSSTLLSIYARPLVLSGAETARVFLNG
jgi:hypothetical protein